jgi:hypothetical protein
MSPSNQAIRASYLKLVFTINPMWRRFLLDVFLNAHIQAF